MAVDNKSRSDSSIQPALASVSPRKEERVTSWLDAVQKIAWVGLGGFCGANARYWVGGWIQARWGTEFPWSTFVINITGSFILGLFVTLVTERFVIPNVLPLRLLIAIGFVGAYTTFSTFEYETLTLVTTSAWVRAFGNAFGSLFAGFLSVWLGVLLARIL
jgi:CrcB protein